MPMVSLKKTYMVVSYLSSESQLLEPVVYLAHPYFDMPSGIYEKFTKNEYNIKEIYNLLKINKVLLRTINNFSDSTSQKLKRTVIQNLIDEDPFFKESYELAHAIKKELIKLSRSLIESNVDIIFIKSLNYLPLDSDNYDILIKEENLPKAREVLKNMNFVELKWVQEPYKYLFRPTKGDQANIGIHLHTQVAWDGVNFLDSSDVWKRRRQVDIDNLAIGMPSPEHHLLITIAHAFFENYNFKLSDLNYIIEDAEQGLDWKYLKDLIFKDYWIKPFNSMILLADHINKSLFGQGLIEKNTFFQTQIEIEKANLTEKAIKKFNEEHIMPLSLPIITIGLNYCNKIFRSPNMSYWKKTSIVASIAWQYMRRRTFGEKQPSLIICFSGQDGVGKTTHAKQLSLELHRRDLRTNYVWARGSGDFFGLLFSIAQKVIKPQVSSGTFKRDDTSKNRTLLVKEPLKTIYAYVMLLDESIQLLIKARIPKSLGQVIVCDRSINDTLIDVKYDLEKNVSYTMKQIFRQIARTPDIVFIMDAEPEYIIKRRNELQLNDIIYKRELYSLYPLTTKTYKIFTDECSVTKNRIDILSIVLQELYSTL